MTSPSVMARPKTVKAEAIYRELNAHDSCDTGGCGARAYAVALIGVEVTSAGQVGSEILFCGHHYRTNEVALKSAGARISDQRNLI